jgi:hypothetical protein
MENIILSLSLKIGGKYVDTLKTGAFAQLFLFFLSRFNTVKYTKK